MKRETYSHTRTFFFTNGDSLVLPNVILITVDDDNNQCGFTLKCGDEYLIGRAHVLYTKVHDLVKP